MSSIKDRQRAAARARLEKEMAERSAAARKRRQRQAIIGSAIAVVLIAGAAVWIYSAVGKDDDKATNTASGVPAGQVACTWTPDPGGGGKVKDVGTPPANVPNTGTAVLTIDTNLGPIKATMDRAKAPCTTASLEFLGSKKFWDNSKCHRLVNQDKFRVLQCGDPFATGKGWRETDGQGGPSYTLSEENLPTDANNPYPAGTIAMANTGQPGSTGSQFFICAENTQLPASYTPVGKITSGLDVVQSVVKGGDDGAFAAQAGGGHPKKEVIIKTMTVAAA